jgi:hypothetical protein
MKQPTPPQSVNGIWFAEDDLTGAIFNNATLTTTGQCTKQEARQAARMMLAAPELLAALKLCVDELAQLHEHHYPECHTGCPACEYIAQARAAIAKAEGGVK